MGEKKGVNEHDEFERLLVYGELNGDMRKVVVDVGVWLGFDGGIIHRVFVILVHWT